MVPRSELRPDVLPTQRLTDQGRPVAKIRADLRRIPNVRNAISVVGALVQSVGVIIAAAWIDRPLVWVAAFILMARGFALLAILAHEAPHRFLFSNRRPNHWLAPWVLRYPT